MTFDKNEQLAANNESEVKERKVIRLEVKFK